MRHQATSRFWKCFENLPEDVQEQARKKFELLKNNPQHPSLELKQVGDFYSARINLFYRALGIKDGNEMVWVWIGGHDDYERMINR